jgi:hypothetical protein
MKKFKIFRYVGTSVTSFTLQHLSRPIEFTLIPKKLYYFPEENKRVLSLLTQRLIEEVAEPGQEEVSKGFNEAEKLAGAAAVVPNEYNTRELENNTTENLPGDKAFQDWVNKVKENAVPEPVAEVVEPVAEVVEPVAEVTAEPVAEVVEPVAEVVEPVAEVTAEPVAEVVEPVAEVTAEPVTEVVEPVAEVVEPVAEVTAEPVAEEIPEGMQKHQLTEFDLIDNPDLALQGLKVGDNVFIPIEPAIFDLTADLNTEKNTGNNSTKKEKNTGDKNHNKKKK